MTKILMNKTSWNLFMFTIIPVIIYLLIEMLHKWFSTIWIISIIIIFIWWSLVTMFFNKNEHKIKTLSFLIIQFLTGIIYIWLWLYWFYNETYYILIPFIILFFIPFIFKIKINKSLKINTTTLLNLIEKFILNTRIKEIKKYIEIKDSEIDIFINNFKKFKLFLVLLSLNELKKQSKDKKNIELLIKEVNLIYKEFNDKKLNITFNIIKEKMIKWEYIEGSVQLFSKLLGWKTIWAK